MVNTAHDVKIHTAAVYTPLSPSLVSRLLYV